MTGVAGWAVLSGDLALGFGRSIPEARREAARSVELAGLDGESLEDVLVVPCTALALARGDGQCVRLRGGLLHHGSES